MVTRNTLGRILTRTIELMSWTKTQRLKLYGELYRVPGKHWGIVHGEPLYLVYRDWEDGSVVRAILEKEYKEVEELK